MKDTNVTDSDFDSSLGQSHTLGARVRDGGTNFALFSENATKVELCLFDAEGKTELRRVALPEMEGGIWYGFLPGIGHGQVYGYRVHGAYDPENGHRFNPNKLLLDPYARELKGGIEWDDSLFGYKVGEEDTTMDDRDSAAFMPKGVVVQDQFQWDQSNAIRRRWKDSVIYEAHVKGLTRRHPKVPEEMRGTFAGLASDPIIEHLHRVGVTAIELLPVHAFSNDQFLTQKGLSNYWGYNTLSFFAPQQAYLRTGHVAEVQNAVDQFHRAGIEVILDVVYNHTCEGNEKGPTLSYRGIDNAAYYLLSENRRHSFDTTGTGNTLNVAHPMVLRMVLDSLRYWVEVMHVDGFRFDLASTLGREASGFEREGAFFAAIRQDPVLAGVKLIAEPWDIGEGGYQVGGFPWPFREWNDKARDDIRAFWRRDPGLVSAMGERLTGSPVQFKHSYRPATSSINFIAAHDGFTAHDTVSYDDKHNEANGEDNRDGHSHNLSHNLGAEGETDDPGILEARFRRVKGMIATLALSQGVPMILAGDEFGQTQGGNNNAYCQDNEITWLDWENADERLTDAVAAMLSLRKALDGYISPRWGVGPDSEEEGSNRISWWHPAGREMKEADWQDEALGCVGIRTLTPEGLEVLALFNTGDDAVVKLPKGGWTQRLDTAAAEVGCETEVKGRLEMGWQSVAVLTRRQDKAA
ncbi:glycogen debranching protein GlgX [Oceaniglobus roseus]|uniref:glycogen debranching protein GlgX n=1 Tax=Oceaniglobus roseus TaxID=1737570 RepID=UPI000C7EA291|nr:glycogen debranching protein GlgX [Kandeliimicrobium roseum]